MRSGSKWVHHNGNTTTAPRHVTPRHLSGSTSPPAATRVSTFLRRDQWAFTRTTISRDFIRGHLIEKHDNRHLREHLHEQGNDKIPHSPRYESRVCRLHLSFPVRMQLHLQRSPALRTALGRSMTEKAGMAGLRARKPVDYSLGQLEKAGRGQSGTPGWLAASRSKSRALRKSSNSDVSAKENTPPRPSIAGKRSGEAADVPAANKANTTVAPATRRQAMAQLRNSAGGKAQVPASNGSAGDDATAPPKPGAAKASDSSQQAHDGTRDLSRAANAHDGAVVVSAATTAAGQKPHPRQKAPCAGRPAPSPQVISLITPVPSSGRRKRASEGDAKAEGAKRPASKRRKTAPAAPGKAVPAPATGPLLPLQSRSWSQGHNAHPTHKCCVRER